LQKIIFDIKTPEISPEFFSVFHLNLFFRLKEFLSSN